MEKKEDSIQSLTAAFTSTIHRGTRIAADDAVVKDAGLFPDSS